MPVYMRRRQLASWFSRTAAVTSGVRKRMVEQEVQRRANRLEDHAQAAMMSEPIPNGESREELQRWADAVKAGKNHYMRVSPAMEKTFNPRIPTGPQEAFTKTNVRNADDERYNGTYYHAKEISSADIRKRRGTTTPKAHLMRWRPNGRARTRQRRRSQSN